MIWMMILVLSIRRLQVRPPGITLLTPMIPLEVKHGSDTAEALTHGLELSFAVCCSSHETDLIFVFDVADEYYPGIHVVQM